MGHCCSTQRVADTPNSTTPKVGKNNIPNEDCAPPQNQPEKSKESSKEELHVTYVNSPEIINKNENLASEDDKTKNEPKNTPIPEETNLDEVEKMIKGLGEFDDSNVELVHQAFPKVPLHKIRDLFDQDDDDQDDDDVFTPELPGSPELLEFDGHYKKLKKLGNGGFGDVFEAEPTQLHPYFKTITGTKLALKMISNCFENAALVKRQIRELRVLNTCRNHPAIVKMYDLKLDSNDYNDFNNVYVFMEKGDGDLTTFIKNKNQWFSAEQVASMIKQLFYALKCMHSKKLVHRDLKPQNILYWKRRDGQIVLKICDFGLARCTERNFNRGLPSEVIQTAKAHGVHENYNRAHYAFNSKPTGHVVTRYYRPPEVSAKISAWTNDRSLMPAIDVWSMGCIMGEMLQLIRGNMVGKKRQVLIKGGADMAFSPGGSYIHKDAVTFAKTKIEQMEAVFKTIGPPSEEFVNKIDDDHSRRIIEAIMEKDIQVSNLAEIFPESDADCLDFLLRCLEMNPTKRLTAEEALNHPYLANASLPSAEEEYNRDHEGVFFEFEDIRLSDYELRCLFVNEIVQVKQDNENEMISLIERNNEDLLEFRL